MTVEAEMQKQLVVEAGDEGLTAAEQFYARVLYPQRPQPNAPRAPAHAR